MRASQKSPTAIQQACQHQVRWGELKCRIIQRLSGGH
jgi:hypothetical protein